MTYHDLLTIESHMSYTPPPSPSILDDFEYFGIRASRKVWRSGDRYFTWDSRHAEVEVFNKRGRHLGALDAATGTYLKGPDKEKRIHV